MRRFAAPLAFLLLSGCAPAVATGGAVGAGGLGAVLAPSLGPAGVVLSEVAAAACAGQAAANATGAIAAQRGDDTVARYASGASRLLGLGCLW